MVSHFRVDDKIKKRFNPSPLSHTLWPKLGEAVCQAFKNKGSLVLKKVLVKNYSKLGDS